MSTTMRAIVQHRVGGPDVLQIEERPRPTGLPTEVVVRVAAIGLNPVEAFVRAGAFPLIGPPPFILGWDIAGVVAEVVPGTNRFQPGDEVFGMPFFPRAANAYAEYVAAPSRQLARKPRTLDFVHAAALPLAGLTAWQALHDTARIRPGQRVLIHAGGGGVGHLAVQIAKNLGAHVITTVSADKADFVRDLGADEIIDYRDVDFDETVRDVDVVLESVGGDYARRSLRTLVPGGLLVTIVDRSNRLLAEDVVAAGRRFAGVAVEPDAVALERLASWVDEGRLRVHVDETFPFDDIARAHTRLAGGSVRGKLVLVP